MVADWTVAVRDEHGRALAGQHVGRSWDDYSHDLSGADDLITEYFRQGRVSEGRIAEKRAFLVGGRVHDSTEVWSAWQSGEG